MPFHPRTQPKHVIEDLKNWRRMTDSTPQRMKLLMFAIDGLQYAWWSDKYGGHGRVPLNCEGGFGYDATVRRMVRDKEVRIVRKPSHSNAHGGNPTINRTFAVVTDRGREVYANWKKKNFK